jgi:hypothetical protein
MDAVSQERHGPEQKARDDLHSHEYGRQNRDHSGAALGTVVTVPEKDVAVGEMSVIVHARHNREKRRAVVQKDWAAESGNPAARSAVKSMGK